MEEIWISMEYLLILEAFFLMTLPSPPTPSHCIKRYFSQQPSRSPLLSVRGIGIRERMPQCLIKRPHGTEDYLLMLFHDPVFAGTRFPTEPPPTGESEQMMIWPHGN